MSLDTENNVVPNIIVGKICGVHGIKGQLRVEVLSDNPQRFMKNNQIWLESKEAYFTITSSVNHKGFLLITLEGINDRNAAEAVGRSYLKIPRQDLAPLPEGSFYHFQLIGLEVFEGERDLGKVSDVIQTGANDIYVVKKADAKEICIPALKTIVQKIDIENGKMEVILPKGLED